MVHDRFIFNTILQYFTVEMLVCCQLDSWDRVNYPVFTQVQVVQYMFNLLLGGLGKGFGLGFMGGGGVGR